MNYISRSVGPNKVPLFARRSLNIWIKNVLQKSSDILVLVYVDDCIILNLDQKSIDMFINTLKYGTEIFAFTDEGLLHKYLGVEIERLPDDTGLQ